MQIYPDIYEGQMWNRAKLRNRCKEYFATLLKIIDTGKDEFSDQRNKSMQT